MKPAPHVRWTVELRGLTVLDTRQDLAFSIPYPHAALWSLLALGRAQPMRARELMALLMNVPSERAEREVQSTLAAWQADGLLIPE